MQDLFCCESVFCCFVGCLCCLWPRLTSKIGELPSQFDALVSEELRDACRAASEADKTREKKLFFRLEKGKQEWLTAYTSFRKCFTKNIMPIYKINKDINFEGSRTRK